MLRFPYLLSLLLCIELSFCYNYIDETTEHNRNNFGRYVRRERIRRVKRPNVRRSPIRQEEDYDRSPVEFDVASFIQPETENLEGGEGLVSHKGNRRSWSEKPFDIGPMMKTDDINNKLEKTPDLMSMGDSLPDMSMNPPLSKDLWNSKHFGYNPLEDLNAGKYRHEKFRNTYKDDLLMNQNGAHNQKKKCSLKALKFPFFSHNKSEAAVKPSKPKKRRLFFFNNSKKVVSKVPDFNKMNDYTMAPYKMKRSYEQRLCPACKKIFVANMVHERPKKNPINLIHNSRQFFQNILPDATPNEEIKDYRTNKIANFNERFRMKRNDADRQLKELEEVQRKIDAVEIRELKPNRPDERKEYN